MWHKPAVQSLVLALALAGLSACGGGGGGGGQQVAQLAPGTTDNTPVQPEGNGSSDVGADAGGSGSGSGDNGGSASDGGSSDGDGGVPGGDDAPALVTEILGQSQTEMWWPYFTLSGWQARVQIGSGYMNWLDPAFAIWTNPITPGVDGVVRGFADIERVVITVGREPMPGQGSYADLLVQTIATVRAQYPALQEIRLQALAGGPDRQLCYAFDVQTQLQEAVRTTANLPDIEAAIATLVTQYADVKSGPVLLVDDCSEFSDSSGHLNDAGRADIGAKMSDYYNGL